MSRVEVVLVAARKSWCVDRGETLEPMNDVELWDAIDRGDVTDDVLVWRDGLECWTPVADLPELGPPRSSFSMRATMVSAAEPEDEQA